MYTTLNKIREHSPCTDGWETLLKYLGKTKPDDEPLPLLTILDSNGFDHALWCFRAVDGFEKEKLLLGIGYAREVKHLMPANSKKALEVFDRYANGLATKEEFEAARRGAEVTYTAIINVSWDAICAARAAARAADAADAACAADAAAYAAGAAFSPYTAAARAATRSTIRVKQEAQLRQLLERTCTPL